MSAEATRVPDDHGLWSAGNYDVIAELFWEAGAVVVEAVRIEAGMTVLDVGTGTGSVAIRAAATGAEVIGLDIAPAHFDAARRRAAEAGVDVEWVEGDAAALPYEDSSFDRVLSAFGFTFAADCRAAADELVRVCRAGGEVVTANWSADGFGGRLSDTIRRHRAPELRGSVAPSEWGTVGHVRRTLGGQLVLAIEPQTVELVCESVDAMLELYEEHLGPVVVARGELAPDDYEALRGEIRALIEEFDRGDGEGEARVAADYLLVIGHKPVAM